MYTYHLSVCAICLCFFSSIMNEYDSFRLPPVTISIGQRKKLKFALEWNYLFIATTIWKILDNHLDGKQKGWKYILEALNSKKIIFTQAGRKHCAKVSSGIENWLIFYLDGFSFDFFFLFVFYRYKVVLPRRSSTTKCFMDYLPFYLFCPAKTNVHTMSNQCYWRSVPHLVTTTMHTIALFIRVYLSLLFDFWSTCV